MNCVGVWNVIIWGRNDVWGGWIMFRAGHQKEFKNDGSGMANGKSQLKINYGSKIESLVSCLYYTRSRKLKEFTLLWMHTLMS